MTTPDENRVVVSRGPLPLDQALSTLDGALDPVDLRRPSRHAAHEDIDSRSRHGRA